MEHSTVASPSPRPQVLLRKSKVFWGVAAVLLIGLIVGLVVWGFEPDSKQFLAAASRAQSAIRADGLRCLSIDPHKVVFDQKAYVDPKLAESIVDILSIRTVLFGADPGTCPWGFFVTAVPGQVSAVRLHGQSARYLVSIGICERTVNGSMNPGKCLTKNIYVFNPDVGPHELFSIALVGLARSQSNDWEVFQSKKP